MRDIESRDIVFLAGLNYLPSYISLLTMKEGVASGNIKYCNPQSVGRDADVAYKRNARKSKAHLKGGNYETAERRRS